MAKIPKSPGHQPSKSKTLENILQGYSGKGKIPPFGLTTEDYLRIVSSPKYIAVIQQRGNLDIQLYEKDDVGHIKLLDGFNPHNQKKQHLDYFRQAIDHCLMNGSYNIVIDTNSQPINSFIISRIIYAREKVKRAQGNIRIVVPPEELRVGNLITQVIGHEYCKVFTSDAEAIGSFSGNNYSRLKKYFGNTPQQQLDDTDWGRLVIDAQGQITALPDAQSVIENLTASRESERLIGIEALKSVMYYVAHPLAGNRTKAARLLGDIFAGLPPENVVSNPRTHKTIIDLYSDCAAVMKWKFRDSSATVRRAVQDSAGYLARFKLQYSRLNGG